MSKDKFYLESNNGSFLQAYTKDFRLFTFNEQKSYTLYMNSAELMEVIENYYSDKYIINRIKY